MIDYSGSSFTWLPVGQTYDILKMMCSLENIFPVAFPYPLAHERRPIPDYSVAIKLGSLSLSTITIRIRLLCLLG